MKFPPISRNSVVLLFGSTGYIGSKLAALLKAKCIPFKVGTRHHTPSLEGVTHILNAAGYTGKPNVDACEDDKAACWEANVTLPARLLALARSRDLPLIHVSSGCVYFRGFNIPTDAPSDNFSLFYPVTKIAAEEILKPYPKAAIVRVRMPFDAVDEPRNYLSKIRRYDHLLSMENSLTFIPDLLDCLLRIDGGGIYHAVNPGSISALRVVELFEEYGIEKGGYTLLSPESCLAARRSNVTLIPSFDIPTVESRVREVLDNWAISCLLLRNARERKTPFHYRSVEIDPCLP